MSEYGFSFKLAEAGQKGLIVGWLGKEHVREWIHGVGLRNTLEGLDRFLRGEGGTQHWIAYQNGIPFGYLLTTAEGEDAISLDVFICEVDFLGKGLAVPMIREFLVGHFSGLNEVFIDPEMTNARAVHVYQRVGFKIIGEFIASWHPVPHYKMKMNMKDLEGR